MFGFTEREMRTYGILSLCSGLQILINQIEQPYARSLIACSTPVNTTQGADFSGSSACGDRLHVIGEGAQLSGSGDSLENFGRLLITLFVSGFADSHGRKSAAIVGWVLITASVACFFLASFAEQWSKTLFVMAQGLQGMSGIGLLGDIVARDIAAAWEGDPTPLFARRNTLGTVLGLLFFFMVLVIQYTQITLFRPVWALVLVLSVAILVTLIKGFPETQPEKDRQTLRDTSVVGVVTNEIDVYKRVLQQNSFARLSVAELFFKNLHGGFQIIMLPWIMANFGYNQLDVMMMLSPCIVIGIVSNPLMPKLCADHGHRKVVMGLFWWELLMELLFLPVLTMSIGFMPVPIFMAYLKTPAGGIMSVFEAVQSRLVGTSESAKLAAIMQLMGFVTGSISGLLYTRVFDAEATSLAAKVAPFLVASAVKLPGQLIFYFGNSHNILAECDKLHAESVKESEKPEDKKEQ